VRAAFTRRGQSRGWVLSPPDDRSGDRLFGHRCSLVYKCLTNAEFIQVCPMSGPSFRDLIAFRISPWNKQIGSDDGVFRDQETSLDTPSKCPMTNSFRCSLTLSESFPRQSVWENIATPTPGAFARTSPSVSEAMLWRPHARFGSVSRFYRNRTNEPNPREVVELRNTLWRFSFESDLQRRCGMVQKQAFWKTSLCSVLSYLTLNQARNRRLRCEESVERGGGRDQGSERRRGQRPAPN
jgi:hypothetical protein